MRKLASIQIISNIEPIKGADKIELATILGWKVVIKKGQFNINDKCIYIEIDSLLPNKPEYEFLKSSCWRADVNAYRIKTIRLRGQISQGLALPLESKYNEMEIGTDLTDLMEIKKYENDELLSNDSHMAFHHEVPKTSLFRIQNIYDKVIHNWKDKTFYITQKLDGISFTIIKENGEITLYSKDIKLEEKNNENYIYYDCFEEFNILEKLKNVDNIAIQGEIIGPNCNKNHHKLSDLDFYVYSIYELNNHIFLNFNELKEKITNLGLKMTPIINDNYKLSDNNHTLDDLLNLSYGQCLITPSVMREGLVFKLIIDEYDNDIHDRIQFKIISNEYLLKYDN